MIYLLILILLLIFSIFFDVVRKSHGSKEVYWFSCLVLILFAGLRYRVGGDTFNYLYMHEYLPTIPDLFTFDNSIIRREPGWLAISAFAKIFGEDFVFVQIILALIANISFFYFIAKHCRYKHSAILFYFILFYCYFNFEILRESISISIFLLFGYQYLISKKYLKYYMVCGICLFFHLSSFILFLVPFIIYFLNHSKNYWLLFTAIYLAGIILNPFIAPIVQLLFTSDIASSKLALYDNYNFTIYGKIVSYVNYIVFPLILHHFVKKYINKNISVFILVYVFIGSTTTSYTIAFRLLNYFYPFLIIGFSTFFVTLATSKRKVALESSILFMVVVLVVFNIKLFSPAASYNTNIKWYKRWFPYHSILDPVKDSEREFVWEQQ